MPNLNAEQKLAVETRNKDILVSAPAGSGKTKILVSRIIGLLEKDNYNVDDLLVLTFTKAAANEMKQRLELEIDKEIEDKTGNEREHLLDQKARINNAYISNFHSFCSDLLSQYGYTIGISNFTINDKPEIIKASILDDCINKWCEDEQFVEFNLHHFASLNFNNLKTIITNLDNLSSAIIDFESFKKNIQKEIYDPIINDGNIENSKMKDLILVQINNNNHILKDCIRILKTINGDECIARIENVEKFINTVDELINKQELKQIDIIGTTKISWKALALDPSKEKYVREINKAITSYAKETQTWLSLINDEDFKESMSLTLADLNFYYKLLNDYQEAYSSYKKQYDMMDFNDLERNTIRLLENESVAKIISNGLKEIMIDEYQDTNDVQERIVDLIASNSDSRIYKFMVGDMKQSIYRFRKADLNIFRNKYNTYGENEDTSLIKLLKNYRSDKVVLDSINYMFNKLMDESLGGLEYYNDAAAKLYYGGNKEDYQVNPNNTTELLLLNSAISDDFYSQTELEARIVARRILEMIDKKQCDFDDIAVLFKVTSSFMTYKKVFDKFNIPNSIVLSSGLYNSQEIITCINIIKALNNPYDDIAYTSLLLNNFINTKFSCNLIDQIKLDNKSMYESVNEYQGNQKLDEFKEWFDKYRSLSYQIPVYKVLEQILEDTKYLSFISSLINSKQRYNNVLLFIETLKADKDLSIFNVANNLDKALKYEIDYQPASVVSGNNTVQFMSIHKSKGLEFKVVILAEGEHGYNKADSRERIINDKEYGLALDYVKKEDSGDYKNLLIKKENPYRSLLSKKISKESDDEDLRVLYVALTRAESKLIISGSIKGLDVIEKWQQEVLHTNQSDLGNNNILSIVTRKKQDFLSLIGPSIVGHQDINEQLENLTIDNLSDDEQETLELIKTNCKSIGIYSNDYKNDDTTCDSHFSIQVISPQQVHQYVEPNIQSTAISNDQKYDDYEYTSSKVLKTIAVTKKIDDNDREFDVHFSDEINSVITGSDRGTLIHNVLELLPVKDNLDLDKELDILFKQNIYNEEQIDTIKKYQNNLQGFIDSDVYKLMTTGTVYKEKKFSFNEDGQIIHGIFDVIVFKDKTINIIDYKTDIIASSTDDSTLIDLHKPQMDYYIKILKKVFKDYDIQAVLYYLNINKSVTIN